MSMDEKRLVQQLKMLSKIQADKQWAFSLKESIINQEIASSAMIQPRVWFANVASLFQQRAVFALAAFVLVAVLGAGAFSGWFGIFQSQQNEPAAVSIDGLRDKLGLISSSLDNLKNIENPTQAATMAEIVKTTVKESQKVVKEIQNSKSSLSAQVLTSLDALEQESTAVADKANNIQDEILRQCFADLEKRTLSASDAARLQDAKGFFEQGNIGEAMLLLQEIGK